MRVRYTGDCYRVVLARGGVYEVLAVEEEPGGRYYRIRSPHIEDDGLFPADQFVIVGDDTPLTLGDYSNLE
jgi:ribosomal protein S4E